MREKCVYLSRGQLHCYLILHLWARRRPKALKIVKAESFRDAFFVVGNGQVFGLFGCVGISFLVLCLALQFALGFFSLFLLPLPLFLSLCKGGSGASSHENSWYYRIFERRAKQPALFHIVLYEEVVAHLRKQFCHQTTQQNGTCFLASSITTCAAPCWTVPSHRRSVGH